MSQPFESSSSGDYPSISSDPALVGIQRDRVETPHRDRFELLSAFIDSELSALEYQQVEKWLASDPTAQKLHHQLLKLRQGLQTMPIPVASQSPEQTLERVFSRLEPRPSFNFAWGAAAMIAVVTAALTGLIPNKAIFEVAEQPSNVTAARTFESQPLKIALDQPILPIPSVDLKPVGTFPNPSSSSYPD